MTLSASSYRGTLAPWWAMGTATELEVVWGIKDSFRRYLSMLPDFQWSLSEGASLTEDSTFAFPVIEAATGDRSAHGSVLSCRGNVLLSGHGGMMRFLLQAPRIETTEEGLALTFSAGSAQRYTIAQLSPTTEGLSLVEDTVRVVYSAHLARAGVGAFNNVYPLGEALDPVVVRRRRDVTEPDGVTPTA
jgi:hypothetical protein